MYYLEKILIILNRLHIGSVDLQYFHWTLAKTVVCMGR